MRDVFHYRLSDALKHEIAQNLVNILKNDENITEQTREFISNWILTDSMEKRKAFFDIWDIVLKNYLPTSRPILFRACDRISKNGKIASFTGRLESARRFSNGKGSLIICDTKETLISEDTFYKIGEYKHTFYPLAEVLLKAKNDGGWGFSERILNEHIGEEEYIMRINLGGMCCVRWTINNF